MLSWKDLGPRLGIAYDLLGNGKTALKASLGRYVLQEGSAISELVNPINATSANQTRTWTDANNDFVVQGDPLNLSLNGELGPSNNQNFGRPVVTTRLDPGFAKGFGVRPNNWEGSLGVQRELLPRVSANVAYLRRSYGNIRVTHNRGVSAADYDPFCVTGPSDPRLPGGGGERICGLFDISVAKRAVIDNYITSAAEFGEMSMGWHGVDLTVNARLQGGVLLQGGVSTGKGWLDDCGVRTAVGRNVPNGIAATSLLIPIGNAGAAVGNPSTRFCGVEQPFLANYKFLGSYTLPWDVQLAGTFQSNPPPQITATYTARNAEIVPTLNRNLASGANGTVAVELVEPGTMYGERLYQADLRIAKNLTFGKTRWQAQIDLYNTFNSSPTLSQNNNYGTDGASWQVPLTVLPARLVKFGMQVNF